MADGTTAGTVIAAVLEGSGYYAQASILDTFQDFLAGCGTLIFVASCMAGIFLTVLYGSMRPALALILGPSIFFFLLEYRTPLDPPAKRVGAGTAIDISDGINQSNEYSVGLDPAQVSWFFNVTTRLSGQVVDYFVSFILRTADKQEVMFLAQKDAMNALLQSQPSRSELQQMMSFTLLNDCSPLLSSILNLSSEEFSDSNSDVLTAQAAGGDAAAQQTLDFLSVRRAYWDQLFVSASKIPITPSDQMKNFIGRETSMFVDNGTGINYAPRFGTDFQGDPAKFVAKEVPNLKITCGAAMDVFADAALVQGSWLDQFIVPGTLEQTDHDTPENRELICRAISDKIFKSYTYTNPCQLGSIAMIYLVKNLFGSLSLNQAAQQVIDRSQTTNNSLSDKCRDPDRSTDLDDLCTTISITQPNPAWAAVTDLNVADVESTQSTSLKTSIVSYAYNIPYYQGVLLYLLAAVFPFWCILVLLPGRAATFLLLPLGWFWVKSWDIGFSLVYVLDEILWNILPSPKLLQDGYNTSADFPSLLRDVGGVDLGYDMLAHYYFVAMCLLAVPLLTGYAILRGRSEVLSVIYRSPAEKSKLDNGQIDQLEYNQNKDAGSAFSSGNQPAVQPQLPPPTTPTAGGQTSNGSGSGAGTNNTTPAVTNGSGAGSRSIATGQSSPAS